MVKNALPVRATQSVLESGDACVEYARAMLLILEQTVDPAKRRTWSLLDHLSERLFVLQQNGFSCHEISLFLSRCEIDLSAESITDYFHQIHAKRVLEQSIDDCYKPEWNNAIERTAFIERGLRQALKEGRGLVVHYQPQVDLFSGEVVGAEALVRWVFNGTPIHPVEFIPVAEECGLINQIGEWVLREACHEAQRWAMLGLGGERGMKIAVNLSVKQFSDDLPDIVHNVLSDTGLPARLLELEITESFLVGNSSLAVLHALRNSGIHLSIDDFGTGYSCLANLKNLPLDTIKIDRAFVMDLGRGEISSMIVESIIDLARKLKMKTLAEGVETEEQAQTLRNLGCTVCQGFLYARPLPAEEFVRFAKQAGTADRTVSKSGVLA